MDSHALHPYSAATALPRRLVVGFVAGAISVIVFHQGALGILHALGLTSHGPYSFAKTAPLGVPQPWSITFWGGYGARCSPPASRASAARG